MNGADKTTYQERMEEERRREKNKEAAEAKQNTYEPGQQRREDLEQQRKEQQQREEQQRREGLEQRCSMDTNEPRARESSSPAEAEGRESTKDQREREEQAQRDAQQRQDQAQRDAGPARGHGDQHRLEALEQRRSTDAKGDREGENAQLKERAERLQKAEGLVPRGWSRVALGKTNQESWFIDRNAEGDTTVTNLATGIADVKVSFEDERVEVKGPGPAQGQGAQSRANTLEQPRSSEGGGCAPFTDQRERKEQARREQEERPPSTDGRETRGDRIVSAAEELKERGINRNPLSEKPILTLEDYKRLGTNRFSRHRGENRSEGLAELWKAVERHSQVGDNWCGAFVNINYRRAGVTDSKFLNSLFAADSAVKFAKRNPDRVQSLDLRDKDPVVRQSALVGERAVKAGDVIVFMDKGLRPKHLGIVKSFDPKTGKLVTIEGNTWGADGISRVMQKEYRLYELYQDYDRKAYKEKPNKIPYVFLRYGAGAQGFDQLSPSPRSIEQQVPEGHKGLPRGRAADMGQRLYELETLRHGDGPIQVPPDTNLNASAEAEVPQLTDMPSPREAGPVRGQDTDRRLDALDERHTTKSIELLRQMRTFGHGGISRSVVRNIDQYEAIIESLAQKRGIDPNLVRGIIAAESQGRATAGAGKLGYKGLMQAGMKNVQLKPEVSIRTGIDLYLKYEKKVSQYFKRYGQDFDGLNIHEKIGPTMIAYNAGPGVVEKAMEYAYKAGDVKCWQDREHFQRALIYYNSYSSRALSAYLRRLDGEALATKLGQLTKEPADKIRGQYFRNGTWDTGKLQSGIVKHVGWERKSCTKKNFTVDHVRSSTSGLLLLDTEFKYNNLRTWYIDRVLNYKNFYDNIREHRD